jgi:Mg-chelatase subunit ChlD
MKFAYPWMLWMVPVVVLVCHAMYVWADRRATRRLKVFLGGAYARHLAESGVPEVWRPQRYFTTLCLVFLVMAGARPYWPPDPDQTEERQRVGADFVIALDASKSMLARDTVTSDDWRDEINDYLAEREAIAKRKDVVGLRGIALRHFRRDRTIADVDSTDAVTRLDAAKQAVRDLLKEARGDRIGLIAFTEEASLRAPMTYDYAALQLTLDAIQPATTPPGGSSIASAIVRAERVFENKAIRQPILIILSDGEDHDGDAAADAARFRGELNGVIYTVGIGSPSGARIPIARGGRSSYLRDPFGQNIVTRMDAIALNRIARNAGGRSVALGKDGQGLRQLYQDQIKPLGDAQPEDYQESGTELYQFLLAFALLSLIFEMLVRTRPQTITTRSILTT